MNQIVSFKLEMIPLILEGKKTMTTRIETPYRLRLDKGDTMYIYSGIRTKNAMKHGEATIINRWLWNQYFLLIIGANCPIPILSWYQFAKAEGFDNAVQLKSWFGKTRYENKNLITYQFKLIHKEDIKKK